MADLAERLRHTHEHGIFDAQVAGMLASPEEAADRIEKLEAALRDAESDGWERGMRDAATICATLAETTYDDADSFEAATGCEAAIESDICIHQRARTALGGEG